MPTPVTIDPGSPTKRELIDRAFSQIGMAGHEFGQTADDLTDGLNHLNDLMADLAADGIDLGYNFPDYGPGEGGEGSGVSRADAAGVSALLAIILADVFGKTLQPQALGRLSATGSKFKARYAKMPAMRWPIHTLAGMGSRRRRVFLSSCEIIKHLCGDDTTDSTAVTPQVVVAPTLGALGLSATPSFAIGTPASGTIIGATALSTISLSGGPAGFTIDSPSRTWSYDGTGSASSGSLTLTETLLGATGSPRSSSIAWSLSPVLGTLALSATSFATGAATSGTITGATASSAIVLANGPAGLTINSAARTWAFDGSATVGSGTLTLTETLAGALGSPKVSSISWTVATGSLDTSLPVPGISYASGYNPVSTYPIAFNTDLNAGGRMVVTTDNLQLVVRNLPALTTALDVTVAVPASGPITFPGLSAITTGSHTLHLRTVRGSTYGNWSSDLLHGPDVIAPTLSAAITPTQTGSNLNVGCTTDEAGTIYAVATTNNVAPTAAQVIAGQMSTGAAATATGSKTGATVGANTFTISGTLPTSTLLYVWYAAKDAANNASTVLSGGSLTTAASTYSTSSTFDPADLGADATLANGNRTLNHAANYNWGGSKSTTSKTGKKWIELVCSNAGGVQDGDFAVGVCSTSYTASSTTAPGFGDASRAFHSDGGIGNYNITGTTTGTNPGFRPSGSSMRIVNLLRDDADDSVQLYVDGVPQAKMTGLNLGSAVQILVKTQKNDIVTMVTRGDQTFTNAPPSGSSWWDV